MLKKFARITKITKFTRLASLIRPAALPTTFFAAALAITISAAAQRPLPRLTAPIDNAARAELPGSQPPRVRLARDLGAVDGSMPLQSMTLVFNRSAAQQAALDALIAAQQDSASPQFHQWLTPAEFGARFGMADADLAQAENWLQSQGFAVESVSPSRDRITFSGSAATVASAFRAPLHHYTLNGNAHIAPSADLSLPAALSGVVSAVTNLSDFRPRPRVRYASAAVSAQASTVRPSYTSSQTGNHFLTPLDIATIYDINPAYNGGYNGSGQSIVVTGQSEVVTSDITNFQTALGQTAKAPILLLIPNTGSSQIYSGDESESDLDLEYTTGIAPGATIYFVYVGATQTQSVFDALTYAIQNNIAPIINISYGECEPDLGQSQYTSLNSVLQQAAAQGQTIVSAAGDAGSSDCNGDGGTGATQTALSVDFPASSQYVTGVGGTEFLAADVASTDNTYFKAASGSDVVSSALSYIPEQAWNDDSATNTSSPLNSGGGGASASGFTLRPSWQTGVPGIPSGTTRLVPDIALDASPDNAPYAYCSSDRSAWSGTQAGSCNSGLRDSTTQDLTLAGGTSFAAPIFAGMVAILNQARGYSAQGVVGPSLYSLASVPATYASAFHDITVGGNNCDLGTLYCSTDSTADFLTTTGYDEATGLGSLDFNNLLTAWPTSTGGGTSSPGFTLAAAPITVTSGSTATSTVTITPANGYTGTIAWTVLPSATIFGGACYSLPSTVVSGTAPVTATLTVTTGTATCASGTTPLIRRGSSSASLHRPASPAHRPIPSAPVTLAAIGLAAFAFLGRRRSGTHSARRARRLPTLLAILLLAGMGIGLSGCGGGTTTGGGGGGGTVTDHYTITLIGTDTAHSTIAAKVTLTFVLTITT